MREQHRLPKIVIRKRGFRLEAASVAWLVRHQAGDVAYPGHSLEERESSDLEMSIEAEDVSETLTAHDLETHCVADRVRLVFKPNDPVRARVNDQLRRDLFPLMRRVVE
jgi:hypothetical protein